MEPKVTIKGYPVINPVVVIRRLLDEATIKYDSNSFDKAELYCYRNPKDYNIVLYNTLNDNLLNLLSIFGGFIVYNNGLLYIGIEGQTYCPIDETIVDAKCDQCKYYRDLWYDCTDYGGVNYMVVLGGN